MKSSSKRIRIDYAPLNVAVSMECLTPNSPAMQVYNLTDGKGVYDPDREVEATVYCPRVLATAADGSWTDLRANKLLTETRWLVNGTDISTLADWTDKYSIDASASDTKGAITVKRNVSPDERYELRFEGVLADTRLGTRIPVTSDPVILSTETKGEDACSIALDDDQVIQYNPFKDRLLLYDYKVANGLAEASDEAKAAVTDKNAYLRAVGVTVFKGTSAVTDGVTLKLYRVSGADTRTEIAEGTEEYVSLASSGGKFAVTLDLRVVTKADYMVVASIEGSSRPDLTAQFSVNRIAQRYAAQPTNGAGIMPGDTRRYDEVMVHSDGNMVERPESILKIDWYTDSAAKAGVWHNEGRITRFALDTTGIGSTYEDDWIDVYVDTEIKPAYSFAEDGSGNALTDESGNRLIFN